jgi:hypothetical protein
MVVRFFPVVNRALEPYNLRKPESQRGSTHNPVPIGVPSLIETEKGPEPDAGLSGARDRFKYEKSQHQNIPGCHLLLIQRFSERYFLPVGAARTSGFPTLLYSVIVHKKKSTTGLKG